MPSARPAAFYVRPPLDGKRTGVIPPDHQTHVAYELRKNVRLIHSDAYGLTLTPYIRTPPPSSRHAPAMFQPSDVRPPE